VDAVPAGQHLPALVDQDVRRKPEAPAGGTGRHPGRRSRARGTRQHRPSTGANARGSSTARGEASTPNFLQLLIRVRHHIERQITSVGPQFVRRGVKQHHLVNGGRRDLAVPGNHRLQMHTADWAAREAPELQVGQPVGIGNRDGVALDDNQLPYPDGVSWPDLHDRLPTSIA
jgi:hypothetical protein